MAVLYHLLRCATVPILTVTDLKQKWGKIAAKTATDLYKATRLMDLCTSMKSVENLSDSTIIEHSLNESTIEESNERSKSSKYRQYTATGEERSQILHHFL
ncbi:AAEL013519-PA [Aedes aegypti]|uniref:AAEL013519-PA n=1 Tax=Aedes aegypti TaxID=7159 RepID=Q16IX2_AEDAE|nr:AAEL013519-PA [Aedes aegypti]